MGAKREPAHAVFSGESLPHNGCALAIRRHHTGGSAAAAGGHQRRGAVVGAEDRLNAMIFSVTARPGAPRCFNATVLQTLPFPSWQS